MKKITLFYRNADENADKEYRAQIVAAGAGFTVNFQFGRRGAHLAEGTKTREPVTLVEAENIFDKLIKEKTGKGYTEGADGTPYGGDVGKLGEILPHPVKTLVPFAGRAQLEAADGLLLRKYDGELADRRVGNARILGERMTRKSGGLYTSSDLAMFAAHGEFFAAFRIMEIDGENALGWSTRRQWQRLGVLARDFPPDMVLAERVQDIAAVIAAGGEGACLHDWDASWGDMIAVKQGGVWTCRVTRRGGTQAVGIADADTGQERGNVKLGGGKCDQVRVGSIIRVEGMGLTDAGKIRQPVAAREWLVKF